MDLFYFIRLFKRNILLLLGIPFLLAVVVYYFTRNQEKVYQSEAVIYTGITTGYSIESTNQRATDFFSTSAQFDNMINLLKSRQTIVETAIRLLAQDLSLEAPNPQYISRANYELLMANTPKRIKDLVVKNNKSGIQREKEEQIHSLEKEIHSLEKEISKKKNIAARELSNINKTVSNNYGASKQTTSITQKTVPAGLTHTVLPGETLSSIASRYGVSRGELIKLNQLGNGNVSPGQNITIRQGNQSVTTAQYHTVQPGETLFSIAKRYGVNINKLRELNNLNNRELRPGQRIKIEDNTTGGNDLYNYALKQVSPDYSTQTSNKGTGVSNNKISTESSIVSPQNIFVKDPIVPPGIKKSDYEKTVRNLRRYYASSDTNWIYGLVHYVASRHYSISAISKIQIYRISNSDLVKLTYTSDDPGICQQTLKIISKVFMSDYKALRINETDRVVRYFQRQVDSSDKKLSEAEDRLLRFNKRNNIINYYEQSKYIAAQKEDLDKYYQDQQIKLSGASASLQELETKMTARDSIYLKSDEINQRKKQLADVSEKIIVNQLAETYNSQVATKLTQLRAKQKKLRNEIKFYVDQLYLYGHSTQGVPIKNILDSWLKNTINYTEAKAALIVLARRKLDFIRTYQKMAPLGAMLTRIEREIKVAEQTYLEMLHSLNVAKMKQQNLEMSTNIKIVDPPFFPIAPNPSKTRYIVIASAIAGFLLIALVIVMLEYFDTSVKNPARVIEKTKMQLAGAYPYLSSKHQANELSQIGIRLTDMMIQNIKLNLAKSDKNPEKPYLILVLSTQNGVGKTLIAQKIINRMRAMGDKVLFLNYLSDPSEQEDEDFNQSYSYTIKNNFIDIENLQQLIDNRALRKSNIAYDFIFLEIPSIIYHTYPIKLLSDVDLNLFIIKGNSRFGKADEHAIESFKKASQGTPMVVLNEVELYNLEDLLTEIPKTKPGIIEKLKAMLTYPGKFKVTIKKEA